jgi:probable phosphoglycerate mutase
VERAILTLVRHGETSANLEGVWHGSTDTPLTERGLAQAGRVALHLAEHFADAAAVYCSPLRRARDTAGAIGERLGRAPRIDPDLAEFDLGLWEGRSFAALHHEHRLWEGMRDDPDFAPHGGESPRRVAERICEALRRIEQAHAGERVIVVAHGGALSIGLGLLLESDYRQWQRVMSNCAVSTLVLRPRPALLSFNETQHLADL